MLRIHCIHPALLMTSALGLGLAACGSDFSDGDFGGVDLLPFFADAESKAPPLRYTVHDGYRDGGEVRYMNFGWSASLSDIPDPETRERLGLDLQARIPKVAPVNPMYFFFDSKGNPLFSPPIKDLKTGSYSMPGGREIRDVNPTQSAPRDLPYPLRTRQLLTDPARRSADYQRPIIDVIMDRNESELLQEYSGLWEVVQVTAPSGYVPDEIKSWQTLEQAIKSGEFKTQTSRITATSELHVINCPIVDSRSLVIPSIASYEPGEPRIPQPRVELWYRSKRVDCYLVNGWETLGRTDMKGDGNDEYRLYKRSESDLRISTLDTDVSALGTGLGEKRRVVAPLGQLFIPRLAARSSDFFVDNLFVTTGSLPRRKKDDPPGYRPVRWWWNIEVSDMGIELWERTFREAKMSDIRKIDDSILTPREGITLNFPLTGRRIPCEGATPGADPCTAVGMICGLLLGNNVKFCELPWVRYGEACAPTIANCRSTPDEGNTPGAPSPDFVERWLTSGQGKDSPEVVSKVPPEWIAAREAARLQDRRLIQYSGGANPLIYSCLEQPVTQSGICYLSCDGSKANELQGKTMAQRIQTGGAPAYDVQVPLDSRCGGELMPGFRCLPVTDANADRGGQFCLKDCRTREGVDYNRAWCGVPTPTYFSDKLIGFDASKHTTCSSINLPDPNDRTKVASTFEACTRNPSFAPFAPE